MSKHQNTPNNNGPNKPLTLKPIETTLKSDNHYQKLQSPKAVLSLIRKAETKRVSKTQITAFLKKKGIPQSLIDEAYTRHYQDNGLYEIEFKQRPLGFCVIKGNDGKNAIISTIEDSTNTLKGMRIASRIYEINGKRVDNTYYKEILKVISQQQTPFYVIFKQVPLYMSLICLTMII